MTVLISRERRPTRLAFTLLSGSVLAAADLLMAATSVARRDCLGVVRTASDWMLRVGPNAVAFVVSLFLGIYVLRRSARVTKFSRWFLWVEGALAVASLIPWLGFMLMAATPTGALAVALIELHPLGYLIAMGIQVATVIWIVVVTRHATT